MKREYDLILIIINKFIKYTYIILYNELSIIKDLLKVFLKEIITNYKTLKEIISNKDKLFILKF